ncbi:beta-mannosidase [Frateuria aurantia]
MRRTTARNLRYLCAGLAVLLPLQCMAGSVQDLTGVWQFRQDPAAAGVAGQLAIRSWHPATVPGSVQTDLLHDGLIPDPFYRNNEAALQWIGLTDWEYRREFTLAPGLQDKSHLDMVFDGLDTFAEVSLNGHRLLSSDNMFRQWRVDVTPWLNRDGPNELTIHFQSPIRKIQPWLATQPYAMTGAYDSAFGDEPKGRDSATYVRKAQYQYGWDWGPRFVTEGVWRPLRIEGWDRLRVDHLSLQPGLVDAGRAELQAQLRGHSSQAGLATLSLEIQDPEGVARRVSRQVRLPAGDFTVSLPVHIDHPQRWYPIGYGAQPIYHFKATLEDSRHDTDTAEQATGLRTVELVRRADRWGRSFSFKVNGIPVYIKGANMVPMDSFPERVTPARHLALLQAAAAAHMNMIRVWGGGYYETDDFYQQADRLGLMIWQDFMFGGAIVPPLDSLHRNAVEEARQQVARLADHPSIVLWCGNNEVQADWDSWDDSLALRKRLGADAAARLWASNAQLFGHDLREVVAAEGHGVPYWATSPGNDLAGVSNQLDDGDYHSWTVWSKSAPIQSFLDITPRFMTEFGLESMPSMAALKKYMQPEDMKLDSKVMLVHQKFGNGIGNQRLAYYIESEYGRPVGFPEFVYLSQLMQAEGIELAVDHLRASRPRNMGVMYWQLNDAWPAASWSGIDYTGRWKALQYHAARFYAPTRVIAIHRAGQVQLSLVEDGLQPRPVQLLTEVYDFDGKRHKRRIQSLKLAAGAVTSLPALSDADLLDGLDPGNAVAAFSLRSPEGELLSRHLVWFKPARATHWPDPGLSAHVDVQPDHTLQLTIHATRVARGVWMDFGALDIKPSDNGFDLLPGETRIIQLQGHVDADQVAHALKLMSLHSAVQS